MAATTAIDAPAATPDSGTDQSAPDSDPSVADSGLAIGNDAGCLETSAHVVANRSDGFTYTFTPSTGTPIKGTVSRDVAESHLNLAYEEPQSVLWPEVDTLERTLFIQEPLEAACDPCATVFEVRLLVRDLAPTNSARTVALSDANTQLTLVPQSVPGPSCVGATGTDLLAVPLTNVAGVLSITRLASTCSPEMRGTLTCALDIEGTFQISGVGPAGERLEVTSGSFKAADGLACN